MAVRKATKDLYKNTLLSLAQARPLHKITLKEIIGNSGTAKQTFYNHFADKYDLINYVLYDFVEGIEKTHAMRSYEGVLSVLKYTKENSYFFTAVAESNCPSNFPEFFYRWCVNYYVKSLQEEFKLEAIPSAIKIAIGFYCHGAVGIYIDWIHRGMVEKKELVAETIVNCRPEILTQYFPVDDEEENMVLKN